MNKVLIELCKEVGYKPASYSGRFMFGKECVSVVTDDSMAKVMIKLVTAAGDINNVELMDILMNTYTDDMGLGKVYYWPKLSWPDDLSEEELND